MGGTPGTALQRNTTWRCGIADRRHPSGVHHPSAAPLVPAEGRGSAQASVSMRPPYSRCSRAGTRAPYSPQRTRLCARYPALPLLCTATTSAAPTSTTFCRSERSKRREIQAPRAPPAGITDRARRCRPTPARLIPAARRTRIPLPVTGRVPGPPGHCGLDLSVSMFARMSRYGPVAGGITRHPFSRFSVQLGRSQHFPAFTDTA